LAGTAIAAVKPAETGKGEGGNFSELAGKDSVVIPVRSGFPHEESPADVRLPEGAAVLPAVHGPDKQGSEVDLPIAMSSIEPPSGRMKAAVVPGEVRDNAAAAADADAKKMSFMDVRQVAPKGSVESTYMAVIAASRAEKTVLGQEKREREAESQRDSRKLFFQEKVDSGSIIKSGVWEEAILPSTKTQKGRLNFTFEESVGKSPENSVVDINSYNIGRPVFTVNEAVPVEGRNLADQILNQLPEETLKGSSRVRISLYPESLGNVDMDIVVRQDRVHVFIIADRADVVQALHGQQEQLKNALQAQGLQVNGLDFQLRENTTLMDDGSRGGSDLWRHQNQDRGEREDQNDEVSVIPGSLGAVTGNSMQNQHVERTISLFV
jgi:hypothetical protein